ADDKALADLDQVALGQKVRAARLVQEIHIKACGHRQRLPSDGGEDGHVDRVVAERHDGGARDGRAWTQVVLAEGLAEPATARPDLLDGKTAHVAPYLRKLRAQETRQLVGGNNRRIHHVMSQKSLLGSSLGSSLGAPP